MPPSFTCWANFGTRFPCPQGQVGGQFWEASIGFCLDLCFVFQHDHPHLPPLFCCSGTYLAFIISHVALYQILYCERRDLFHFFYLENQWSYQSKIPAFFFWHNLCLVKLCSILDHFCSYFFGYHFFQTMPWALHPADQLSSLNAVAPALHCCPHGLKPLLWGSPSSYPFMYWDRKKLHFFY